MTPTPATTPLDENALGVANEAFWSAYYCTSKSTAFEAGLRAYLSALPVPPVAEPPVAWMTTGRLPNKHKSKTHFTTSPVIADIWTNSGMIVIPLRGRLSTLDEVSTDPPPHPVKPHTPGWNPVDAPPVARSGEPSKDWKDDPPLNWLERDELNRLKKWWKRIYYAQPGEPDWMTHPEMESLLYRPAGETPSVPKGWRAEVERIRDNIYRPVDANGQHSGAWFACNDVIDALNALSAAPAGETRALNAMAADIAAGNQKWWTGPDGTPLVRNAGELLMLVVSEIVEAFEGERKNLMDDKLPHRRMAEVEIADAIVRLLDYSAARGYDLDGALREKLAFNAARADHKTEAAQIAKANPLEFVSVLAALPPSHAGEAK